MDITSYFVSLPLYSYIWQLIMITTRNQCFKGLAGVRKTTDFACRSLIDQTRRFETVMRDHKPCLVLKDRFKLTTEPVP